MNNIYFDDETKILRIILDKNFNIRSDICKLKFENELESDYVDIERNYVGTIYGLKLKRLIYHNSIVLFELNGKLRLRTYIIIRESKLQKEFSDTVDNLEPTIIGNEYVFDFSKVIELSNKIIDRDNKNAKEARLKEEDSKFNTLFIAGKLESIGVPTSFATIENDGQMIKIKIPGAQTSEKFMSYILIEVCKTKKKYIDLDDNTKVNIIFQNEHVTGNRRAKLVPFNNLTLSAAVSIIESFKQVYFKDINNDNEIQ